MVGVKQPLLLLHPLVALLRHLHQRRRFRQQALVASDPGYVLYVVTIAPAQEQIAAESTVGEEGDLGPRPAAGAAG